MSDQKRTLTALLPPRGTNIRTGSTLLSDYAFQYPTIGYEVRAALPFKYALALAYLSTPQQINDLIARKAERLSDEEGRRVGVRRTKEQFFKGFKQQAGSTIILETPPQELMDIAPRGTSYDARIISKGGRQTYDVALTRLATPEGTFGYDATTCCKERYVNEGLRRTELDCGHVTTLMVLAELGHILEGKQATKVTGLLPRQRLPKAALPFSFFEPGDKEAKQDYLFDMLWNWSVNKRTQRELNMAALDEPNYSTAAEQAFTNGRARFIAIGEEEQYPADKVTPAKEELYAAMRRFKNSTINHLQAKGFRYYGRGLEFRGTQSPVVAEQWTKGDHVYALCTYPGFPLIVAHKVLDERTENWMQSSEARARSATYSSITESSPQQELPFDDGAPLIGNPTVTGRQPYLDDSTRRRADLEVIIPGVTKTGYATRFEIPRVLARQYARMAERITAAN